MFESFNSNKNAHDCKQQQQKNEFKAAEHLVNVTVRSNMAPDLIPQ